MFVIKGKNIYNKNYKIQGSRAVNILIAPNVFSLTTNIVGYTELILPVLRNADNAAGIKYHLIREISHP